jgi:parallel beta-helix repeat protein
MKKSANTALILILLLTLSAFSIQPTKAAQIIYIINPDGSIFPQNTVIQQVDNVYTLTSDVDTSVVFVVLKSDIVLNGNGHKVSNGWISIGKSPQSTVSVTNATVKNFDINITTSAVITILDSSNITIANNIISGGSSLIGQLEGIAVKNSNFVSITGNNIRNAWCGIHLSGSYDNLIVGNTIRATTSISWGNYGAAIIFNSSFNNLIYNNAFLNDGHQMEVGTYLNSNTWDNGEVGNFWSDYKLRYPNATEIDSSSIGNTPYVINTINTDHYPLMHYGSYAMTTPTPTLTSNPTPIHSASPSPSPPIETTLTSPTSKPSETALAGEIQLQTIAVVLVASTIIIGAGLLVYFKKHKGRNK